MATRKHNPEPWKLYKVADERDLLDKLRGRKAAPTRSFVTMGDLDQLKAYAAAHKLKWHKQTDTVAGGHWEDKRGNLFVLKPPFFHNPSRDRFEAKRAQESEKWLREFSRDPVQVEAGSIRKRITERVGLGEHKAGCNWTGCVKGCPNANRWLEVHRQRELVELDRLKGKISAAKTATERKFWNAVLKEVSLARNPGLTKAGKRHLIQTMHEAGADTFRKKMRYVRRHMPHVTDPAAFVGYIMQGEKR